MGILGKAGVAVNNTQQQQPVQPLTAQQRSASSTSVVEKQASGFASEFFHWLRQFLAECPALAEACDKLLQVRCVMQPPSKRLEYLGGEG